MDKEILTAVAQVGFPIAVTVYLLTRFQRSMDQLTEKIGDLVAELKAQQHR